MMAHRLLPGAEPSTLIVCDHASADVPPGIVLGLPAETMATHIALDIGAGLLATGIGQTLDAPVFLARWSRLVADPNRPVDHPGMAPALSDGVAIPGNIGLTPAAQAERVEIHASYHAALDAQIASHPPALIVAVHSFTPTLVTDATPRPWPVALLWNRDDRAVAPALAALDGPAPGPIGRNQPYSGCTLNYTMDRHAEDRGIPYLGFEVRQDQIANPAGIERWANILARAIAAARTHLAAPA